LIFATFVAIIGEALVKGETVTISTFGSFKAHRSGTVNFHPGEVWRTAVFDV
jgi:nucleoid DNA-binding protein